LPCDNSRDAAPGSASGRIATDTSPSAYNSVPWRALWVMSGVGRKVRVGEDRRARAYWPLEVVLEGRCPLCSTDIPAQVSDHGPERCGGGDLSEALPEPDTAELGALLAAVGAGVGPPLHLLEVEALSGRLRWCPCCGRSHGGALRDGVCEIVGFAPGWRTVDGRSRCVFWTRPASR
jgi:hypothetical protein